MYRSLNPDELRKTVTGIKQRAEAAFPDAGLTEVTREMEQVTESSIEQATELERPLLGLRWGVGITVSLILICTTGIGIFLDLPYKLNNIGEFLEAFDSGIHALVLIGGAIFFLASTEARIKRRRALKAMNQLRSIAHIVDMHQLTKDPRLPELPALKDFKIEGVEEMNTAELVHYLDLCSEMLAILGKLSALFAQHFQDRVVLDAVNEIEILTNGLSRKIWQKMDILLKSTPTY